MEQTYLIDKDKELAETLLGRSDEMKCFYDKSDEEKIAFIEDVLKRLKPYIDADKYAFAESVEKDDIAGLGNHWNGWLNALKVYSEDKHIVQLGWNCEHGKVFQYFENYGGGVIFVSYYSEGHPNKEFKDKWEFRKHTSQFEAMCKMEVTNEITPICEAIKDFMVK